jgi:hypothetical protein
MLKKIFLSATLLMGYVMSFAQTDSAKAAATPPPVTITGSFDGYYRFNFNAPQGGTNNYTSFTNSQSSFELGMASIRADHSFGKASVTVDLGFGRRAQEYSYNDGNGSGVTGNGFLSLASIKQAFVSYAVTDKFKLTMGKWGTHIGYEVLDAYLNRNYSMDYMFSYGPFSHTGIKADFSLGGVSTLMVGIANPTDHATDVTGTKYFIAQFGTGSKNGKFKAYLNYQGADGGAMGSVSQFDLVATGTITDKFSVGYNGTVYTAKPSGGSSATTTGSAVYLNLDPVSTFGLTLRGEYLDNKKYAWAISSVGSSIFDLTLSGNIKVGNLTIIPELRLDNSSEAIFKGTDGTATKSTFTGILAATYHF